MRLAGARILLRLRSLFRRDQLDDELAAEFAFHLEEQKAELLAQGLSEAEAEAEARRLFGPVTPLRAECRDTRRTQWLEDVLLRCQAYRPFAPGGAVLLGGRDSDAGAGYWRQ
jgi:hypothetical protein